VSDHTITRIWQEYPGEICYRCSCGTTYKHQRLPVYELLWSCGGPNVIIDEVV
jgi:hypothetical protein